MFGVASNTMGDEGIFATTAEVQRKATARASAVSNVEAYINDYMAQAESLINVDTEYNWSDNYAVLNADVKGILKLAASAKAAMYVISYDTSGFNSNGEATLVLNLLDNEYRAAITILRKMDPKDFMINA